MACSKGDGAKKMTIDLNAFVILMKNTMIHNKPYLIVTNITEETQRHPCMDFGLLYYY